MPAQWKNNPLDPVWRIKTLPVAGPIRPDMITLRVYQLSGQIDYISPVGDVYILFSNFVNDENHIQKFIQQAGDISGRDHSLQLKDSIPHTVAATTAGEPMSLPLKLIDVHKDGSIGRTISDTNLRVDISHPLEIVRPASGLVLKDDDGNARPLRLTARGGRNVYKWALHGSYPDLIELHERDDESGAKFAEITVPLEVFEYIGSDSVTLTVRAFTDLNRVKGIAYAGELDHVVIQAREWDLRPRLSTFRSDNMVLISTEDGNRGVFRWVPHVQEDYPVIFPLNELFEDLHIPSTSITFDAADDRLDNDGGASTNISPRNTVSLPAEWDEYSVAEVIIFPVEFGDIENQPAGSSFFGMQRQVQSSSSVVITATDGTGESVQARVFMQREAVEE